MSPADLSCRDALAFLYAYLGDELDATARSRFDRHLSLCPSCRAYLDSYRATIALARAAWGDTDTGGVGVLPEELFTAILASRTAPAPAEPSRPDGEPGGD